MESDSDDAPEEFTQSIAKDIATSSLRKAKESSLQIAAIQKEKRKAQQKKLNDERKQKKVKIAEKNSKIAFDKPVEQEGEQLEKMKSNFELLPIDILKEAKEEEEVAKKIKSAVLKRKEKISKHSKLDSRPKTKGLKSKSKSHIQKRGFRIVPLNGLVHRPREISQSVLEFAKLRAGASRVPRGSAIADIAKKTDGILPIFKSKKS
ncbi:hypothetical protein HK096_002779 [Nowakowskiella sp. JEL0078]|nr:hypothetical protein HK096_002779 [Nowakowskiella sp. JEL0078]